MPRAFLLVLATLGLMGWGSVALAEVQVADIEIETGAQEMQDTEAGDFWADLDEDLTAAIEDLLGDRMDGEGGAHVRVRVDRVALTNAYDMLQTEGTPFLEGRVTVIGPTMSDSQLVRVSVADVLEDAEGADLEEQYEALIDAFAQGVVGVLE